MVVTCPIWGVEAEQHGANGDYLALSSERTGGYYEISRTAVALVAELDVFQRARLTSWIINQRLVGIPKPMVTSEVVAMAATMAPLSPAKRADRVLRYLSAQVGVLGERTRVFLSSADDFLAWSESTEIEEIVYLLNFLEDQLCIRQNKIMAATDVQILVRGYERLEEISQAAAENTQGFVAMWFDASMEQIFVNGIVPAIRDAGYEPMRIDGKQHNNKIDDEIIAEIRRSKFVVADFTHGDYGPRGGVYYEAGFAHGLSIPVIFTIRADMIGSAHFDTRQYSHILWTDAKDLRKKLSDRLSATLGDGPLKSRNT